MEGAFVMDSTLSYESAPNVKDTRPPVKATGSLKPVDDDLLGTIAVIALITVSLFYLGTALYGLLG
jgi:hypothetical protein